jgi:hypothetical protein
MDTQMVYQFFMCLLLKVKLESKIVLSQLVKEKMREEKLKKLMKIKNKHNLPMILLQLSLLQIMAFQKVQLDQTDVCFD